MLLRLRGGDLSIPARAGAQHRALVQVDPAAIHQTATKDET
jgi:hypothetical protein